MKFLLAHYKLEQQYQDQLKLAPSRKWTTLNASSKRFNAKVTNRVSVLTKTRIWNNEDNQKYESDVQNQILMLSFSGKSRQKCMSVAQELTFRYFEPDYFVQS